MGRPPFRPHALPERRRALNRLNFRIFGAAPDEAVDDAVAERREHSYVYFEEAK